MISTEIVKKAWEVFNTLFNQFVKENPPPDGMCWAMCLDGTVRLFIASSNNYTEE